MDVKVKKHPNITVLRHNQESNTLGNKDVKVYLSAQSSILETKAENQSKIQNDFEESEGVLCTIDELEKHVTSLKAKSEKLMNRSKNRIIVNSAAFKNSNVDCKSTQKRLEYLEKMQDQQMKLHSQIITTSPVSNVNRKCCCATQHSKKGSSSCRCYNHQKYSVSQPKKMLVRRPVVSRKYIDAKFDEIRNKSPKVCFNSREKQILVPSPRRVPPQPTTRSTAFSDSSDEFNASNFVENESLKDNEVMNVNVGNEDSSNMDKKPNDDCRQISVPSLDDKFQDLNLEDYKVSDNDVLGARNFLRQLDEKKKSNESESLIENRDDESKILYSLIDALTLEEHSFSPSYVKSMVKKQIAKLQAEIKSELQEMAEKDLARFKSKETKPKSTDDARRRSRNIASKDNKKERRKEIFPTTRGNCGSTMAKNVHEIDAHVSLLTLFDWYSNKDDEMHDDVVERSIKINSRRKSLPPLIRHDDSTVTNIPKRPTDPSIAVLLKPPVQSGAAKINTDRNSDVVMLLSSPSRHPSHGENDGNGRTINEDVKTNVLLENLNFETRKPNLTVQNLPGIEILPAKLAQTENEKFFTIVRQESYENEETKIPEPKDEILAAVNCSPEKIFDDSTTPFPPSNNLARAMEVETTSRRWIEQELMSRIIRDMNIASRDTPNINGDNKPKKGEASFDSRDTDESNRKVTKAILDSALLEKINEIWKEMSGDSVTEDQKVEEVRSTDDASTMMDTSESDRVATQQIDSTIDKSSSIEMIHTPEATPDLSEASVPKVELADKEVQVSIGSEAGDISHVSTPDPTPQLVYSVANSTSGEEDRNVEPIVPPPDVEEPERRKISSSISDNTTERTKTSLSETIDESLSDAELVFRPVRHKDFNRDLYNGWMSIFSDTSLSEGELKSIVDKKTTNLDRSESPGEVKAKRNRSVKISSSSSSQNEYERIKIGVESPPPPMNDNVSKNGLQHEIVSSSATKQFYKKPNRIEVKPIQKKF